MMVEVETITEDGRWDAALGGGAETLAQGAVEAVLAEANAEGALALSILLADDAAVRDLNRAWRGQDKPTNVLSFPAPPQPSGGGARHLGDIALAYQTVAREAEAEGKSFADHFTHLVVHGTLHLLGHDHAGEAEAEIMEAREVRILAALGVADPYRDGTSGAEVAA